MTLREACDWGASELTRAGIGDAALDAWYLLEHVTGIGRAVYFADQNRVLSEADETKYRSLIEKRSTRIPLQHLTGVQEFMGLEFQVNGNVLIPRQDTEVLVEHALDFLKKGQVPAASESADRIRILDMCTGSGCILISVLHYADKTGMIEGVGSDFSARALETAAENARRLGTDAEFVRGDLFEKVQGKYGMILSNPPYIRTEEIETLQEEVRIHDPREALDGKEDGLFFYREIVKESTEYLEPGGILAFEIGWDQAEAVSGFMRERGYTQIRVIRDLAGLERVVSGILPENR